jgi:hypothetical protein
VDSGGKGLTSAELYDPATGLFASASQLTEARWDHTATLLDNATLPNYGKVLIVGSVDATAELYDPVAASFAATGSMAAARTRPTATLLSTGKVLVAGGNSAGLPAELYDPTTGTFALTGNLSMFRVGHTATLLLDGRVLIAGGGAFVGGASVTAELYNPATGTFTATGSMTVARTGHTATRLQDGTVLTVGTDGTPDLYDPSSGTFVPVGNVLAATGAHTASLRNDGTVLVPGGYETRFLETYSLINGVCTPRGSIPFPTSVAGAEQFAPESEGFTAAGALNGLRDTHTATVLADGTLLIVGGIQHTVGGVKRGQCKTPISIATTLSSAELYR